MPFQYLITGFLLFFIVTQLHVVLSENTHTRQDASSLHSETIYWIGGLNGIWQDPKNWNLGYQIHPSTSLHCMYSVMPPTDLENGGKFRLYSDKTWNWFQWLNRSSGHYCHPSLTESSPVNLLLNISRKISPHDSIHNPMEETLISNIDIFKSSTNNNEDDTFILDEVFGMPFATHEISIIIPSTKNIYQKLSSEEHEAIVQRVVTSMVKIAGGVTTLPGNIGYWMSQHSFKQELVSEEITIVTMNIPNLTKEIKRMVKEIAVSVAKDLNQEAVFVKIDTHAFLVTP
ncbi:hypothetical protein C9374_010642 [Naegleria lovaniensis]|uniref:Uncharacterized protein n=1 Tax=Naegleria lovaniensis TaxID=51637 RepID=A0AA88GGU3_NAELO|nr:uncharacterized protein C9374_010642 [Naegleria lovaniensis]KAG2374623.1 hypothetical protein C9374_010642 [Naegleria lovaniensis]